MQSTLFIKQSNNLKTLVKLKVFLRSNGLTKFPQSSPLKILSFSNEKIIWPILTTQSSGAFISLFNKLQTFISEKFKSLGWFSKTSTNSQNQNSNNDNKSSSNADNSKRPPPNPVFNMLMYVLSFYLAYSIFKDFERMTTKNRQGVVQEGTSGGNAPNNTINTPDGITISISPKIGNTYGKLFIP